MKQFKDDVYDTLNNHLGDYKKLKKGIVKLHKVYVKEEFNHNETNEADATHQHNNQRRYLEKNLDHNRWQLSKEQTVHKQEYSRIMKENVTLLQEINTLRSREHKIQLEIEGLERIINNIKKRGRGVLPDDAHDTMTEEQHRQLEASQNIEMLSDEVTQMDAEIDYLLNEQKEIQAQTNVLRQVAAQRQNEMQNQQPDQQMQHRLTEEAMPETVEQPSDLRPSPTIPGTTEEPGEMPAEAEEQPSAMEEGQPVAEEGKEEDPMEAEGSPEVQNDAEPAEQDDVPAQENDAM